jgi:hypothetical protein
MRDNKRNTNMKKTKLQITLIASILILLFFGLTVIGQMSDNNTESIYIDLSEEKCKEKIYSHVNSGFECSGVGEYRLSFFRGSENRIGVFKTTGNDVGYSFRVMDILVQENQGQPYVNDLNIRFGEKAEFRVRKVNGKNKPFALIFRVNVDSYNITTYKSSDLFVAKLTENMVCVTDIVKPIRNQNIRARELADISRNKPCLLRELRGKNTGTQNNYNSPNTLVTENSVGGVKLGMTLAEARRVFKNYTFSRTMIGYRDLGIVVKQGEVEIMNIDAGEGEDPDTGEDNSKLPENAKIVGIEVLDRRFKTAEGVYPKMLIADAEKIYGKIKSIDWDDEVGEFGKFSNQPKGYYFSLRGPGFRDTANSRTDPAGIYGAGGYQTQKYKPKSYIYSIAISRE